MKDILRFAAAVTLCVLGILFATTGFCLLLSTLFVDGVAISDEPLIGAVFFGGGVALLVCALKMGEKL